MNYEKTYETQQLTTKTLAVGKIAAEFIPPVSALAEPHDDRVAVRRIRQLREHDALFLTFAEVYSPDAGKDKAARRRLHWALFRCRGTRLLSVMTKRRRRGGAMRKFSV